MKQGAVFFSFSLIQLSLLPLTPSEKGIAEQKIKEKEGEKKLFYLAGAICNSFLTIDYTNPRWLQRTLLLASYNSTPDNKPDVPSDLCLLVFSLCSPLPPCTRVGNEYKKNDGLSLPRLGYKTLGSFCLGLSFSLITLSKESQLSCCKQPCEEAAH